MTLHFGSLYWPSTRPDSPAYSPLLEPVRCDALVVGGGMTGIACGYTLARSGIDTVLIEQSSICSGSTSANTGILQYSNDIMLSDLADQIGEYDAAEFYRACKSAVEQLVQVAAGLPRDVDVKRRNSFYYASNDRDLIALEKEFEMLSRHGFGVEWWDAERIGSAFPFRKSGAIVTHGDAELNPYRFVSTLAESAVQAGLRVYEKTKFLSVDGRKGSFVVRTNSAEIHAEHVVYAVGYTPEAAGGSWIRAKLNRSYAMVTKPLDSIEDWPQRFMLWETARPYLYLRTTADNRIVIGGLDESFRQPVLSESEVEHRSLRLLSELKLLFPNMRVEKEYEWCGTFGESADNLPWIGEDPSRPGQYYALGYGGNGTIYSAIAARLIRDDIMGIKHPISSIVAPDRKTKVPSA
ncbi:FAD-binding oxidoreductase [Cohnella sp. AR92]|uniref:NAD(P)/FAD-dependent oxidoreductase n=1 Tax=Cohnella sp. AR92 TaxID=648716 RepID=UPI000F8CA4F8|nr:FAD-binding oxidoreductase [Cohnella sp. AR92]RUS47796.1 FAD-binding oxidoreductase [Cohnella sp. AR92]